MTRPPATTPIDAFLPHGDIREYHEIKVRAPAALVFETARRISFGSLPLVRLIFWLRARILGATDDPLDRTRGFVDEALRMGWRLLAEERGRYLVAGAVCRPWTPEVVFSGVSPDQFNSYAEPDRVKIVWMIRAEDLGSAVTRFSTETRAAATDAGARAKFRRYWQQFGAGIVLIRWLLLPAVRKEAERRYRAGA